MNLQIKNEKNGKMTHLTAGLIPNKMQHKADIICIIFVRMIRFAPHFCSVSQSAYTWVHTGTFFGYTLSK